KLTQPGPLLVRLVLFRNTQVQILPGAAVGPTNGFVSLTDHDVQVASGNDKPYFHDEAYRSVFYRIYTMQFPGNPGVLVRVARPASDAASTQTALGWLLAALIPAGALGAAAGARLARGAVVAPSEPAHRDCRADQGHRRPQRADRDARQGRDQPARAGIRRDDGRAGRICRRATPPGRRRLARAAHPAHQPDHQPRTARR